MDYSFHTGFNDLQTWWACNSHLTESLKCWISRVNNRVLWHTSGMSFGSAIFSLFKIMKHSKNYTLHCNPGYLNIKLSLIAEFFLLWSNHSDIFCFVLFSFTLCKLLIVAYTIIYPVLCEKTPSNFIFSLLVYLWIS